MRVQLVTGLSALLIMGAAVAPSATAYAAVPTQNAGTHTTASQYSQYTIDVGDGDRILAGLRQELRSNQDPTRMIERLTGMDIAPGYRATELTFREIGTTDDHEQPGWRAVFTYLLVDADGDEHGGARNLYFDYAPDAERTVTTDAEQYAGNDELTLSPKRSFQTASNEMSAWLTESEGVTAPEFDMVVLRKPIETPHFENKNPVYVFHVVGDSENTFYGLDSVTGEAFPMNP